MKKFILGAFVALILPVFAAVVIWPNGVFLETFQNGFIFGSGKVLSVLNDVITFDDKRLDDRSKKIFHQEDFDGASVSFTCGTNLTASDETSTPLAGLASKDFDQGGTAAAAAIECAGPTVTLEVKAKGKFAEVCFNSTWDGNDNEMALNVYDNTNTIELVQVPIVASTVAKEHCGYFNIASDTASIDYDIEVLTGNNNTTLRIDDLEFKVDPLAPTDIYASSEWTAFSPVLTGIGVDTLLHSKWKRIGDSILINMKVQTGTVAASDFTIPLPNGYTIKATNTTEVLRFGHIERENVSSDETIAVIGVGGDNFLQGGRRTTSASTGFTEGLDGNALFGSTAKFSVEALVPVNELSDTAQGVVVKNRTDSSSVENSFSASISGTGVVSGEGVNFIDGNCTKGGTGIYNCTLVSGVFLAVPNYSFGGSPANRIANMNSISTSSFRVDVTTDGGSSADDGFSITLTRGDDYIKESDKVYTVPVTNLVENVFSARVANNGTATVTSESSSFIESVSRTALGRVTINFKAGLFSQIPKLDLTLSDGAIALGSINFTGLTASAINITTVDNVGDYDDFDFTIGAQRQGTDYIAPQGVYLGTFGQPTCYVKDVKSSGTAPQSAGADGVYVTRELNTTEGSCSFLSLSSNTITLQSGAYDVDCSCPAAASGNSETAAHKCKIYDVDNTSDLIIGTSEYTARLSSGSIAATRSEIIGNLALSVETDIDIRHAVAETGADLGSTTTFGDSEVYTQCKITKVR